MISNESLHHQLEVFLAHFFLVLVYLSLSESRYCGIFFCGSLSGACHTTMAFMMMRFLGGIFIGIGEAPCRMMWVHGFNMFQLIVLFDVVCIYYK